MPLSRASRSQERVHRHPLFWLFVLGLLWGANFVFMKSTAGFDSTLIVWVRLFFGALALSPFLPAALRNAARDKRLWLHTLVMTCCANLVTFHCFMEGAVRLGAGMAGVISGTVPLITALLAAVILPGERLSGPKTMGLFVSFAGIVCITAPWRGLAPAIVSGTAFMLLGALGYAMAFVYARRFLSPGGSSPLQLASLQMAAATLLYAPLAHWSGLARLLTDWSALANVALGLGVLGSGAAYVIYYGLIQAVGAVTASSVTYLPPLVALGLGWAFLGERVGPDKIAGALLVLCGIFMLRKNRGS